MDEAFQKSIVECYQLPIDLGIAWPEGALVLPDTLIVSGEGGRPRGGHWMWWQIHPAHLEGRDPASARVCIGIADSDRPWTRAVQRRGTA